MYCTHQNANTNYYRKRRPPGQTMGVEQINKNYAQQRYDGSYRQLDAARDDHERLGNREKAKEADQIGRIGQVDRRQKTRIDERDNGPDNQDQNEQSNILLEHRLFSIGR